MGHVHGAALQAYQATARLGDHLVDQVVHGWRRVPVVSVLGQSDATALVPAHEAEGPGPHGVFREGAPPLLEGSRADDAHGEHGQVGQKGRVRTIEGDAHRVAVDPGHTLDLTKAALPVGEPAEVVRVAIVPLALKGEDHRVCIHHRAIVEADAAAQPEGPNLAVRRDVPARGQGGLHLGRALLVAHQLVEDLHRHLHRLAVAGRGRIQREGIPHAGHFERDLARWVRRRARTEEQQRHR